MSEIAEVPKKERWVYAGQRLDGEKLAYVWYALDEEDKVVPESGRFFTKMLTRNVAGPTPKPGAVFVVHTTKGGDSVTIGGENMPRYLLANNDKVVEWQLLTEAAKNAQRANKLMKEDMSEDHLERCLRPITKAMQKTNHQGRQAIKLVVMQYLSGALISPDGDRQFFRAVPAE